MEAKRKRSIHRRRKKILIENSEDMKLDENAELTNKAHIYSQELNQHLLDEIAILTTESEALKHQINECDLQKDKSNKVIITLKEEIRNIISAGGHNVSVKSSGVISSKITALCKQNRHLISELELYKSKYGQLERKFMEMEASSYPPQLSEDKFDEASVEKEPESIDQNELKEVKEKLSQMTRKFVELKNRNTDLKNELLMANKYLQSEIGPTFRNIQKITSDGYKGRAEEILILKAKVSELEEKLYGKSKNNDQNKESYNQLIKDIETRRKSQIDKTAKDLELLQIDHNELKLKHDGALARNKILTCEIMQLKQLVQELQDKTLFSEKIKGDTLVQMKEVESKYQGKLAESDRIVDEIKYKLETVEKDLEAEKYRVKALVTRLEEKNEKIHYLNEKLGSVVDSSLQKIYYSPLQISANNEIKTLTNLLNKTNKRLEDERKKTADTEKMYFRAREAKLVMQRKYARMGLELKNMQARKTRSDISIHTNCNMSTGTSASTVIHCSDKDCIHFEVERTQNRLELAQEQIKFLETRVKILDDEKASDFENIDEMIFTSKKVFADALRNYKEMDKK